MAECQCYARRHLGAAVSAFHAYALAVSQRSGVFYSDTRRDGWEFGVSKNTITSWTQRLEEEGWLRRLDEGRQLKRNKLTGMYDSVRYEVLDHDSWAVVHPGKCRFREPSSRSQRLGQVPVPVTGSAVPIPDSTGPNLGAPPVPKTGTKQEVSKKREEEKKPECSGEKSSPPLVFSSLLRTAGQRQNQRRNRNLP